MGHGDRPALADLIAEQRHHRARGAQHVTEADNGKDRLAAARRHGLQHHLGEPLGGAHHVGGAHRFVGGDQNEVLHTGGFGAFRRGQGADDVVAHARRRIGLDDRHMLVGRRVIKGVDAVFPAKALHVPPVDHRAEHGNQGGVAATLLD